MPPILILFIVLVVLGLLATAGLKSLFYSCAPNEVLIFSGGSRRVGDRLFRYRLTKGGFSLRKPLIERVDRMDLTNMTIDLTVLGGYSKGGIPLAVNGVANVKVAGHEPILNNAIERFLGKKREEIMSIAKATLEGSLRGVLATMTPEQVNEDRLLFAERLVAEVEQDMTALGLVVDTLKIQNVSDEVRYLDSIGRIRNAELNSSSRIAEATARADAEITAAENQEREVRAQVEASINIAKADAQKRLTETKTQREVLVAEERSIVAAQAAQAKAEIDVQKARLEQVKSKLEADIIAPARAQCTASENQAKATTATIIEDGRARAEALRTMATSWKLAGDNGRQIFLLQKLEPIVRQLTASIAETKIEKVTMIDPALSQGSGTNPARLYALNEQLKQVFGIDLAEKVKDWSLKEPSPSAGTVTPPVPASVEVKSQPAAESSFKKRRLPTPPPVIENDGDES